MQTQNTNLIYLGPFNAEARRRLAEACDFFTFHAVIATSGGAFDSPASSTNFGQQAEQQCFLTEQPFVCVRGRLGLPVPPLLSLPVGSRAEVCERNLPLPQIPGKGPPIALYIPSPPAMLDYSPTLLIYHNQTAPTNPSP